MKTDWWGPIAVIVALGIFFVTLSNRMGDLESSITRNIVNLQTNFTENVANLQTNFTKNVADLQIKVSERMAEQQIKSGQRFVDVKTSVEMLKFLHEDPEISLQHVFKPAMAQSLPSISKINKLKDIGVIDKAEVESYRESIQSIIKMHQILSEHASKFVDEKPKALGEKE